MKYLSLAAIFLFGCAGGYAPHFELNRKLYNNHTYVSDIEKFGISDVWEVDCNVGDCESLSLCLMEKLGATAQLVLCQKNGEGHAIVKKDGWYYDPTFNYSGEAANCKVTSYFSYYAAFRLAAIKRGDVKLNNESK